ncbi:MAG: DNA starvation/stationary phase protection protein [Prevotellaceae bacterium]|jgi:starvation-inducible DNA-binding protein|nr:DNA starvation/stationary phase protection protein [Prevotellaceae bacterium]
MSTLNYIGLDEKSSKNTTAKLNDLLANLQVFYTNVRGFHWDIEGKLFFTLHAKFEELYDDLAEKIDEVAERILMLGEKPVNAFSEYLKVSEIKEVSGVKCGKEAIQHILNHFKIIIVKERIILNITDEANDTATNDLISSFIDKQEKLVWMYNAFLTNSCETK